MWDVNQLSGSLLSPVDCSFAFLPLHHHPQTLAAWLMTVCFLCTNKSFLTFLHLCLSLSLLFCLASALLVLGDTYNIPLDPRGKKRSR